MDDWIWKLNSAEGRNTLVLLGYWCQISRCLSVLDAGRSGRCDVRSVSLPQPQAPPLLSWLCST